MTRNQIEYVKLLETRRSNRAVEDLTRRRDEAAISQKTLELGEAARHNKVQEGLTRIDLGIRQSSLDETTRHNQSVESLERGKLDEVRRTNRAKEAEAVRHNKATESLTRVDLTEKGRHNLVTEAETQRHNQITESESHRHNLVGEVTDASRIALDTVTREQQLAETKRHNLAMEVKDMSPKVSVSQTQTPSAISSTDSVEVGSPSKPAIKEQEQDPYLRKIPPSEKVGQFYMSRPDLNGKRNLMYAFDIQGQRGWAAVKEDNIGRQYIIVSGKKYYLDKLHY